MQQVKRIGVGQTAKVMAALYFVVAAVFALIALPFLFLARSFAPAEAMGWGTGMGIVFVILVPFLYALAAFVATALFCALYNFVASKVGGVEVELGVSRVI